MTDDEVRALIMLLWSRGSDTKTIARAVNVTEQLAERWLHQGLDRKRHAQAHLVED